MTSRLEWHGDKILRQVDRAKHEALRKGAEYLLAKANETVPHDEGILEQSGTVSGPIGDSASVSYGGAASDYAIVQHEGVDHKFQGKGRAKWLELTMKEQRSAIQAVVLREFKRGLGG